ncbi:MAG: DtxR family transcriptional regulator [Planctomycetes bacterium]|nr:DtxR family transcriptional regulator [Planctomycetota bacterium]
MGLFTWWARVRGARTRVLTEDALKHMHACEWRSAQATTASLSGALRLSPRKVVRLCQRMQEQGWIEVAGSGLRLTATGQRVALQVIRAHRLWERYLVDEARVRLRDVHAIADRLEHKRSHERLQAMDVALGFPTTDPHGDPIPTAEGRIERTEADSVPLPEWPVGRPAVVVHLEDEPKSVFSQIAALGLRPGQRVRIIEADEHRIVFADDQTEHVLSPVVAANVFVAPAETPEPTETIEVLSSLKLGDQAIVHGLDAALHGYTRRRLLDLGVTSGASITAEYAGFFGDPIAFRVRGALIALRREQADHVLVRTNGDGGSVEHAHG